MRIFLHGVFGGIVILAADFIISYAFQLLSPALAAEYQNPALFRPWSDPLMSLYFLEPFVLGIALSWVWDKTKQIVSAPSAVARGARFGAIVWVVFTIPGMIITYASFPLTALIVASWAVAGLVGLICVGTLFAKLNP